MRSARVRTRATIQRVVTRAGELADQVWTETLVNDLPPEWLRVHNASALQRALVLSLEEAETTADVVGGFPVICSRDCPPRVSFFPEPGNATPRHRAELVALDLAELERKAIED